MVSSRNEMVTHVLILSDLIQYCIKQGVPFTEFEDWKSISAVVKEIVAGKTTVAEVAAAGAHDAKRA
jgi:2-hydroxy-3-keto-5-methylthiopentenyl-1-phosphate phosphatase